MRRKNGVVLSEAKHLILEPRAIKRDEILRLRAQDDTPTPLKAATLESVELPRVLGEDAALEIRRQARKRLLR